MSRSQKTAVAKAAQVQRQQAARPAPPRQVLVDQAPPTLEVSPEFANRKHDDVVAAFLGKPVAEAAAAGTQEGETTEEDTTTESTTGDVATEAETETETNAADDAAETETETPAEGTTPLDGITAALSKHPELKGLTKRITDVFKQNSERAEALKQLEAKPATVLPPSAHDPFSAASTEQAIDAQVASIKTDAKSKLRWLNRHLDGGVWGEGSEVETEMTAAQVDAAIDYYEAQVESIDKQGAGRKAYLASYAETVKTLGIPAAELVEPKVAHRESKLLRDVPEIMKTPDYLQVLADAKAGREIREAKAKGVQYVTIDPSAKKEPVTPKKTGSSAPTARTPKAEESQSLEQLREQANKGSQRAQQEITRRFMQAT